MDNYTHYSVLLKESIDMLSIKPDGIYVDCTIGGAGHAKELLKRNKKTKLIGFDKDQTALNVSKARLEEFKDRVTLVKDDFKNSPAYLEENNIKVHGIYADLGVSSHQIDTADRGFSFRFDAPLDMRMDTSQGKTAKDIVNEYSESELKRVIKDYGEERFASSIARKIVNERKKQEIKTL